MDCSEIPKERDGEDKCKKNKRTGNRKLEKYREVKKGRNIERERKKTNTSRKLK